MPIELSPTQNSQARALTANMAHNTAQFFYHKLGITADQATNTGVWLVAVGTAAGEIQNILDNKNKVVKVIVASTIFAGFMCDGLDGAIARVVTAETGYKDPLGPIKDTLADRKQERIQKIIQAISNAVQGRPFGAKLAMLNVGLRAVPSTVRAADEALGYVVPETGGFWNSLGTRSMQALLSSASTVIPEVKGVSTQPWIEGALVAANIYSTANRVMLPLNGKLKPTLSQSQRIESLGKAIVLGLNLGKSVKAAWDLNRSLK